MRTRVPDKNIFCKRCGKYEKDLLENCQEHHIIPIICDGTDSDGRRYLCIDCHTYIHNKLNGVLWKCITDKNFARDAIRTFTKEELKYDPKPIM